MIIERQEAAADRALVAAGIRAGMALQEQLLEPHRIAVVLQAADAVTSALRQGGKLLVFGNGGSAADAQHIAAEFVGRYLMERSPLPALALSDNGSAVTAIGNDYAFADVFARQIEALGRPGDVAIALSTSGESPNVLAGVAAAHSSGLRTIAFTGASGRLCTLADICVEVPSVSTPRVQEAHMLLAHLLCEVVERRLAGDGG